MSVAKAIDYAGEIHKFGLILTHYFEKDLQKIGKGLLTTVGPIADMQHAVNPPDETGIETEIDWDGIPLPGWKINSWHLVRDRHGNERPMRFSGLCTQEWHDWNGTIRRPEQMIQAGYVYLGPLELARPSLMIEN